MTLGSVDELVRAVRGPLRGSYGTGEVKGTVGLFRIQGSMHPVTRVVRPVILERFAMVWLTEKGGQAPGPDAFSGVAVRALPAGREPVSFFLRRVPCNG
jgi:hypothetical protein